ncbi:MAG TPA: L,D-transpeptidase family protein [Pseudolabrys sp.]|nr:L,D-transpeptidase family protein [Pseudolabrys sp.]
MRTPRLGRVLAGTMLALIVATPGVVAAAPDQAQSDPSSSSGVSSAGDSRIGETLRAIITTKRFDKRVERAADRKAIESFYAARKYAPLWVADGGLNARGKAVVARRKNAGADGLDAADYPVPGFGNAARPEQLADGDIMLTNSVLTFARHLAVGRIAPGRVFDQVDYADHTPDPSDILRKLTDASDVNAAFDSFNPPDQGFKALKDKLATLAADGGKRGRMPALRDRIIANMERWRWLPHNLARTYVMVNIPDYTLKVVHEARVVWRTKIVAGKPRTPTPLLSASMDNVLVNPSWYVPQSIIQNELLPRYASDPQIFDRMGLEVKRGADGNINVVQPPGAANALGRIKFNFPNKYQVYLHDTPEKRLFAADKRAFSHGCMRVENPTKFGEIMLHLGMRGATPSAQQLAAQFGGDERTYNLTDRPAVYLTYQTAFVDDAGKLQLRDDIYGFDARIIEILRSDERRAAEAVPAPDPTRDAATVKSNQDIFSRAERREAQGSSALFDQLFR